MRIAALLLMLTGCFVVPAKSTTTRNLGIERSEPRMGLSRGLLLTTTSDHSTVLVTAIRKRDCKREVSQVIEVTEDRHLHWSGVDDPRAGLFALVLAPVTVPVSLIISGISVAADSGSRHEQRRLISVETEQCTQPAARLPVEITFASGIVVTRYTGVDGTISFALPAGEPYQGVIQAKAEMEIAELKYHRKLPAVTSLRAAVTKCAQEAAFTGPLEVRVAVNPAGLPTKVELDRGDTSLTTCITTQIASARFPESQRDQTLVLPFSLGQ